MEEAPEKSEEEVANERIGTTVAEKYKLLRLLGYGGMGAVYEAENGWTRRRVALKLLRKELGVSEANSRRFRAEAQNAANLRHASIVDVLDMGQDPADGALFLVQELLNGNDLRKLLKTRGRLTPAEAVGIIGPVAGALVVAHDQGVLHRDIKPENIFLSATPEGALLPKVIDFGISKDLGQNSGGPNATGTGMMIGTPLYMSPEQARGDKDIDGRADVFSLGDVLFELLVGWPPFKTDNWTLTLVKILSERAIPIQRVAGDVPQDLAALVDAMLQHDRNLRPDMRTVANALAASPSNPRAPLPASILQLAAGQQPSGLVTPAPHSGGVTPSPYSGAMTPSPQVQTPAPVNTNWPATNVPSMGGAQTPNPYTPMPGYPQGAGTNPTVTPAPAVSPMPVQGKSGIPTWAVVAMIGMFAALAGVVVFVLRSRDTPSKPTTAAAPQTTPVSTPTLPTPPVVDAGVTVVQRPVDPYAAAMAAQQQAIAAAQALQAKLHTELALFTHSMWCESDINADGTPDFPILASSAMDYQHPYLVYVSGVDGNVLIKSSATYERENSVGCVGNGRVAVMFPDFNIGLFDPKTGGLQWKVKLNDVPKRVRASAAGDCFVAVLADDSEKGLDTLTGAPKACTPLPDPVPLLPFSGFGRWPATTVSGTRTFTLSKRPKGTPMLTVEAVDGGTSVWKRELNLQAFGWNEERMLSIVSGGTLVVFGAALGNEKPFTIKGLNPVDGVELWSSNPAPHAASEYVQGAIVFGSTAYFSIRNSLYAIDLKDGSLKFRVGPES